MTDALLTRARGADVSITGGGTVYLFELLTEDARAWVDEHVSADRQMLGRGLAVEHRYAAALAEGMQAAGLLVGYEEGR
jgi:acyl CoA:acetate/3-ketoacid CoA transferase alpha subunit